MTKLTTPSDRTRRTEQKTFSDLPPEGSLEFSRNSQSPKNGCFRLMRSQITIELSKSGIGINFQNPGFGIRIFRDMSEFRYQPTSVTGIWD